MAIDLDDYDISREQLQRLADSDLNSAEYAQMILDVTTQDRPAVGTSVQGSHG